MIELYAVGFNGKWYQTLNQAFNKMIGEIEYDLTRTSGVAEEELKQYLKRVTTNVTNKFVPYSAQGGGNRLQNRSGRAKSELRTRHTVRRTDNNKYNYTYEGSVKGPGYLNIQEDGGTLTASSGYIAIPLPAALTSNGLPLKPSPRDWKNTFTRKSKKGNIVIFQKRGRRTVALYVLKKSVTIPARLGLAKGFDAAAPYFEKKVLDKIDRLLSHT